MSELVKLDARCVRGNFTVTTKDKVRYWLLVDKRPSGYMQVISDRNLRLQTGVVGGLHCCPEPIVRVNDHLHLVAAGRHIIRKGLVVSITPTDVYPAMLACRQCGAYRPSDARCNACGY